MELKNGRKTFHAKTRSAWRKWLEKNHEKENAVLLILYNKISKEKSVSYSDAVEEALCYGWIDSTVYKRDHESKYQHFAKRKQNSLWSKSNRGRVEKLMEQGLMKESGLRLIDHAKKTGTWLALEEVENIVIPNDLRLQLSKNKKALKNFETFSPSSKKIILVWLLNAKKSETRIKRIKETVQLAAKNIKANHYEAK